MEYALSAIFYIFKTLFNTMMNMPIVASQQINVSSIFVACIVLYGAFRAFGFARESITKEINEKYGI